MCKEVVLQDITENYDAFLFDAYGVFWDGAKFISGAREIMQKLVAAGKPVFVVSNGTLLASAAEASYAKKGLLKDVHYTKMITSGEVLHESLINSNISFAKNHSPRKYYVLGMPAAYLFEGSSYQETDNPALADFVYFSVPRVKSEDLSSFPDEIFYDANGKGWWDCATLAPFEQELKALLPLPALNANPDLAASEKDMQTGELHFVIRQGSLAEAYRQMGGEVLEFGKPHANIFDYACRFLTDIPRKKILMVGDTVRTDIKWALGNGLSAALCVNNGITLAELQKGANLTDICRKENISVADVVLLNAFVRG